MKRIEEQPDKYLATTTAMLVAGGMSEAASIVRTSTASVAETEYGWAIAFEIDAVEYAQLGTKKGTFEEQISNCLDPVIKQFTDDWFNVRITPKISTRPEWREQKGDVSAVTRRNIIDGLKLDNVKWYGRLDDLEFLGRLYDLEALPSYDSRYKTASGDIGQHRFNNDDWEDDWVYDDARFDLIGGPVAMFLRFLCEVVHPVVRSDRNEALKLVREPSPTRSM